MGIPQFCFFLWTILSRKKTSQTRNICLGGCPKDGRKSEAREPKIISSLRRILIIKVSVWLTMFWPLGHRHYFGFLEGETWLFPHFFSFLKEKSGPSSFVAGPPQPTKKNWPRRKNLSEENGTPQKREKTKKNFPRGNYGSVSEIILGLFCGWGKEGQNEGLHVMYEIFI